MQTRGSDEEPNLNRILNKKKKKKGRKKRKDDGTRELRPVEHGERATGEVLEAGWTHAPVEWVEELNHKSMRVALDEHEHDLN